MAMISYETALRRMLRAATPLGVERVPLRAAHGRVLAEHVRADTNIPPFDRSTMDGYACRRADLLSPLRVVAMIPAGVMPPARRLRPGECAKIMTGAIVPAGADCVVKREDASVLDAHTVVCAHCGADAHITRAGSDARKGGVVLRAGTWLAAPHLATLALMGCTKPQVYRRPRVGVLATGSELRPPRTTIRGAQIRDSNSQQLLAQIAAAGAVPRHFGIAPDNAANITARLRAALRVCDVVLISGGVSVGDLDLVPGILRTLGCRIVFHKVAMKPGKPFLFARAANSRFCCGLPGNPVSTFVAFELLVKPFLYKLMGHVFVPRVVQADLAETIIRKTTDRREAVPVRFTSAGVVAPVPYHGSGHLTALTAADGLVFLPIGTPTIERGTPANVRLL
jgi:molybdopterin molybdotransferase